MDEFFAREENQVLYVKYYIDLNQAVEDYYTMLKKELEKYFKNPGKIISINNAHLGFLTFAHCMYALNYEKPNHFNVLVFVINPEEERTRKNILLELENFLKKLSGAEIPLRPPIIEQWLSIEDDQADAAS